MISRVTYRNIKSMNKEQLNEYLNTLHAQSYNLGVSAASKTISENVVNGLKQTKGLGEKRIQEALTNITAEVNKSSGKMEVAISEETPECSQY